MIENTKIFQVPNANSNEAVIKDVFYNVNSRDLSRYFKNLKSKEYICICSGGTTSSCAKNNLITIDLRKKFNHIKFNKRTDIVEIGGGTKMGDLLNYLENFDRTFPIGLSRLPGVGYILTGGISPLSRRYGLAIDNLIFAKGFLGNGEYFEINKNKLTQKDMNIWECIKGAGQFFGIITSIGLKTFVANPLIIYEGFVNSKELTELIHEAETFPNNMSLQYLFSDNIYIYIVIEVKTLQDKNIAENYFQKFKKYTSLKINQFKSINKIQFFPRELKLFELRKTHHSEVISLLGEDLNNNVEEFIRVIIEINHQKPNKSCYVASQQLGGASYSSRDEESSFINRECTWKPWIYTSWEKNNKKEKEIAIEWMNTSWEKLKKFYPKIHLAQLHNHLETHNEEVHLAFGSKLNKMRSLKNFCDPSGNLPPL